MRDFITIFNKNFISTWSMPIWVISSMIYPVFWLVLFGSFIKNMDFGSDGSIDYFTFFVPGIIATIAIFTSLWSGIGFAMDKDSKVLERILFYSKSNLGIMGGYIIQGLTAIIVQGIILLIIAVYMDANLHITSVSLVQTFLYLSLLGIVLASISHIIAILVQKQEELISIANFLTLPLMFISSLIMPISSAPTWLSNLANFNPVYHATELIRASLLNDYVLDNPAKHILILVFLSIGSLWLSSNLLKRLKIEK